MGKPPVSLLWRRHLCEWIACINLRPGIGPVAVESAPREEKLVDWVGRMEFSTRSIVITTAACALTTAIAEWLFRFFDASNLVALFMFTVVVVSLRFGRAAAIWAALLSVACFDFFFIPPLLSFAMSDTQYLFTFALILIIALVASDLGSRLRADARSARAGERREAA